MNEIIERKVDVPENFKTTSAYKGGHEIPPNVLAALKYLAKVGVLPRDIWS